MSRKYALFVGNCDYDSESLYNLESPIADVQDLANLFRDTSIGGFDEVKELINSTESKIRQIISSFFLHKKPEDLLLLYFSGHGILDDKGDLYLAAKDTQPDLLRATAISADFIADDMDRCRSKRQILILDCCHSGAFRRGIKGDEKVLTASTFEGNGSGRIVLTASDRREFAMEGNQVLGQTKTSLFTHFLLEGIKSGEADKDGDSLISLDEWYDFAYDKVVENLSTQTPRRWVYNQEGRLIIARNPKPIKPAELAWELREAIKDDRPTVRLGAISELAHILNSPNKRLTLAARNALLNLLKDDSPEVRETADRVLAGNESVNLRKSSKTKDPVQDRLAGLMSIWTNLWSVLRIRTVGQWRSWMIAFVIVVAVGLAGGGLVVLTDTNSTNGGAENSSTEQADMGTLGILDTSLEESDQKEDILESSISTENQPPDTQEAAGQQTTSSSFKEEPPAEGGITQRQGNLTSPDEQRLMEKGDPTVTYSEPEIERDEQQSPLLAVQPDEENIAGAEVDPAGTVEPPLNRVKSEIEELQLSLMQAIMNRQWANVPAPLRDYYYDKMLIKNLYSRFNIIKAESRPGVLQSDEATATLHVTVHISYQQKGREDLQPLSIPANWVWIKGDEGFVLSDVRRP
jgi:hypothetical protein